MTFGLANIVQMQLTQSINPVQKYHSCFLTFIHDKRNLDDPSRHAMRDSPAVCHHYCLVYFKRSCLFYTILPTYFWLICYTFVKFHISTIRIMFDDFLFQIIRYKTTGRQYIIFQRIACPIIVGYMIGQRCNYSNSIKFTIYVLYEHVALSLFISRKDYLDFKRSLSMIIAKSHIVSRISFCRRKLLVPKYS